VVALTAATSILLGNYPIAWPGVQAAIDALIARGTNSVVATPVPASTFLPDAEPKKAPSPVETVSVKAEDQRPVFDVIRVEAAGDAVIAGHASPNSAIELRDEGLVLAQANADGSGQFVILPPLLSAGAHHLQLATRTNDAAVISDAVAVNIPAPAKALTQVASAAAPAQTSSFSMTEATKTAEEPPRNTVTKDGRTTKVIRGDNLWRISQHYFGDGMRYPQIYVANASQIRSPHLIYPGEVLVIPQASAPKK
jgi:nucleoid-associated protein YgaU